MTLLKKRVVSYARYLPEPIRHKGSQIYSKYFHRKRLRNIYKTNYDQSVLLSLLTFPFIYPGSYRHTNYLETQIIGKVFYELGFNVDVINYDDNDPVDYDKYRVIFGFGNPVNRYYLRGDSQLCVIFYNAGRHNYHQNQATLNRIRDFHEKLGVWLLESGRFVESDWSGITRIADAVIVSGNEEVRKTYTEFTDRPVFVVPIPSFQLVNPYDVIAQKSFSERVNYLWFGGKGLIHKGLDLLLDIFANDDQLHLTIAGPIRDESKFTQIYQRELTATTNIHNLGMVPLESLQFKQLLQDCTFVVFPSCSEGGAASVVNVCANGGLIPIVSKESSVEIRDFGIEIQSLDQAGIRRALEVSQQLSISDIRNRSLKCAEYFRLEHSPERYYQEIKKSIVYILDNKN